MLDAYMDAWLRERPLPVNLREAIRYALLAPGKRLRPTLTLRCCEAVGGTADEAMAPAAAIEMIHAFSLVHDDLPAMDDDDLRRGRPTLHRQTNEAMAILAGDALLGLSVELVIERLEPAALAARVSGELIRACNDMIAGQVYDTLPSFDREAGALEHLQTIHRHKTGALIRASCRSGAICGGASEGQLEELTEFGEAIGLMFQIVDDLLDVTQTTEHLGKTAGKDVDQEKLTYPSLIGIDDSRREVERLQARALAALDSVGPGANALRKLCDYLTVRTK
jgi:geranylgeranyl diphosphate synthase type II